MRRPRCVLYFLPKCPPSSSRCTAMGRSLRSVKKLIRSWIGQRQTIRRRPAFVRPWLELMEDRLAPATGLTGSNPQLLQSYGQLPMSFEANAGQTNAQVQFLAHGSGYAFFLTSTGAVLSLETPSSPPTPGSSIPTNTTGVALAM